MTYDLVIIGGGASGVAALTAYASRHPSGRVALVDPEEIGFGRAFGFVDPMLLTNTPVGVMSLDVADPHDRSTNYGQHPSPSARARHQAVRD